MNSIAEYNSLSSKIINAAMEVHKNLGPGLLEGVYEDCLVEELVLRGVSVKRQVRYPIRYKGHEISHPLIIDLLVGDSVIVELKAVSELLDIHSAQLLSYLKLSGIKLGLLINFNTALLRDGIKRIVNNL